MKSFFLCSISRVFFPRSLFFFPLAADRIRFGFKFSSPVFSRAGRDQSLSRWLQRKYASLSTSRMHWNEKKRRLEKRVRRESRMRLTTMVASSWLFSPSFLSNPFFDPKKKKTQNLFFDRLKKEMKAFMETPPPFIPEIYVDDSDITTWLFLMQGPPDTPYAGGWCVFVFPGSLEGEGEKEREKTRGRLFFFLAFFIIKISLSKKKKKQVRWEGPLPAGLPVQGACDPHAHSVRALRDQRVAVRKHV